MSDKYVWSGDEEMFRSDKFDTRELALKDADEYYGGDSEQVYVWTGKMEGYTFEVDAGDIIEQLGCQAGDEVGEAAEDWPETDREQEKELGEKLTAVVNEFFNDHALMPLFYKVVEVQEHRLHAKETP